MPLNNVLVIGAGTGGDVAIALAQGAKHVDAVEIDPMLLKLGTKLNANKPYHDSRVSIHINDGRAFLERTSTLYDMIIFALPDSLTILSGQSSLRLENYLFTLEAFQLVKKHLQPHGVFTMYNYYRDDWLVNRLASMLTQVFHHQPCVDSEGANNLWLSVLSISPEASALHCPTSWNLSAYPYANAVTDDYPFIYLDQSHIAPIYVYTLLLIFIFACLSLKLTGASLQSIKSNADLFLLGAAFLLLEAKNIINFALFFGSTWLVNALVFIGILLTVYAAIEVTNKIKVKRSYLLYILLLSTLALSWLVPEHKILALPLILRFIAATVIAFAPIFVANLIFANRFRQTINSTEAFGANLIGTILGGLLEYASLLIGNHDLLLIAAALYLAALILMKRKLISIHP